MERTEKDSQIQSQMFGKKALPLWTYALGVHSQNAFHVSALHYSGLTNIVPFFHGLYIPKGEQKGKCEIISWSDKSCEKNKAGL